MDLPSERWFACHGLRVPLAILPEIRAELARHTALERGSQGHGDTDLMKLLCVQLFVVGDLRDVLLIWAAKQASFDAAISLDVHLLCGAGLAATVEHLARLDGPEAAAALASLRNCEEAGDFAEFSPERTVLYFTDYYSTTDEG